MWMFMQKYVYICMDICIYTSIYIFHSIYSIKYCQALLHNLGHELLIIPIEKV